LVVHGVFCVVVAAGLVCVIVPAFQLAPPLMHAFHVALAVLVAPFGLLLLVCGLGALLEDWRAPAQERHRVWGAVQLWGSPDCPVIVGELADGAGFQYRARYGRVIALASSPPARKAAPRLGVPVVPAEWLELYACEFGTILRGPVAGGES
jgi:hypothetical protein